jgi:hypothetical protein
LAPNVSTLCRWHGHIAANKVVQEGLRFDLEVARIRAKEPAYIDRSGQFIELLGLERLEEARRNARVPGDIINTQTSPLSR